ncbi:hypothetical protein QBC34DRAFT_498795 [Podospora aff. communis PSN243]|uniref:Uncharacterized protein n=1 Tax=Podospora aff. communis PSN243 TaxID=3040156 RepID=A0AAV9G4N9_9PEZI|nr:hypothetical protein QBC34DRAFT_498795 [Podospora aff. communis PSN243]
MASTLGRFTASFLTPTQETTLALASLNFDFSLFKVQAPDEYLALGSCLSDERRNLAEAGSHHVTARKLGALFRSKLPAVPNLIRSYGNRVSEIAKSTTATTGPENPALKSVLGNKLGIDGTSIWAAATSGTEALCEAISIWAEIVESRKQELSDKKNGEFEYSELAAINTTLSRDQLAEWDSSARAWLRTADKCKLKEQTQLRLIIDNLDATVSPGSGTYESVVTAWVSSMKIVDNLVQGVPQSIYEGAALIGISSWHLYPDMLIYQPGLHEIHQRDPLIRQGGLLTVGLDSSPTSSQGVSWALPLAKLRYYGDPVTVQRTFNLQNQHVSFEQLALVILGGLAKQWPDDDNDRLTTVCTYYKKLWSWTQRLPPFSKGGTDVVSPLGLLWAKHLAYGASKFLALSGEPKQSAVRLMEFGLRRCSEFLNTDSGPVTLYEQLLGLSELDNFLSVMKGDSEAQIRYIRDFMRTFRSLGKRTNDELLIIWSTKTSGYCWATCLPESTAKVHYRWCSKHILLAEQKKTDDTVLDRGRWFRLCGDVEACGVGLYMRSRGLALKAVPKLVSDLQGAKVEVDDVLKFLDREPPEQVYEHIKVVPNTLSAVGIIGEIYSALIGATISLESVKTRLGSTRWFNKLCDTALQNNIDLSFREYGDIPNTVAFACLAMMETGDQNLEPGMLDNVMGMACGDSIYVGNSLALDPHKFSERRGIFRALGNVGKPGISLLIPPPDPIVRKSAADEWNVITHSRWDGKENLDLFGKTSLQLVLTEYRVPYVTQHRGVRDSQTFFQEAAISVYDGAAWVFQGEEEEEKKGKRTGQAEAGSGRIRTVVNWHELLDKPSEPVMVLTKGNWVARLATAAMSAQLGYKTAILPEKSPTAISHVEGREHLRERQRPETMMDEEADEDPAADHLRPTGSDTLCNWWDRGYFAIKSISIDWMAMIEDKPITKQEANRYGDRRLLKGRDVPRDDPADGSGIPAPQKNKRKTAESSREGAQQPRKRARVDPADVFLTAVSVAGPSSEPELALDALKTRHV